MGPTRPLLRGSGAWTNAVFCQRKWNGAPSLRLALFGQTKRATPGWRQRVPPPIIAKAEVRRCLWWRTEALKRQAAAPKRQAAFRLLHPRWSSNGLRSGVELKLLLELLKFVLELKNENLEKERKGAFCRLHPRSILNGPRSRSELELLPALKHKRLQKECILPSKNSCCVADPSKNSFVRGGPSSVEWKTMVGCAARRGRGR